ncbi:helix-turn-helix transcriptional regulator [Xanthobacter dioxanivorans]|uniref:Helix-turn-helix transcriptional regulator n=1 Tax=Xanthobacter dioxanivorans TaxID=2528964 RepID=A0A974SI49_9HYPH|nr:helix-turn-helix transcriptional regulator [Xanthobacter dioxanivorans]QRG06052.1 helix-turn-helix transcriptional regulator [Xanthobacter dioxanivorans]
MYLDTQEHVHRLWDEVSDFEASQSTQAAAHLMSSLADMVHAWNATWAGAIRVDAGIPNDLLQGWRVAAVQALRPVEPLPDEGHFKETLRLWDRREIDPSFLLPLRGVGTFRTYSLRRELPPEWFETPFFHRHYGSVGTQDAVFVAFPLTRDCESHFGFYSRRTFAEAEIARLAYALRGIKWFHRHLMLSSGLLMASSPLTPTEHKVLQFLLTKASEKEVAREMGMATSTAHQHVTNIFRKFGVRSRAELMSLWLKPAA